MSLRRWMRSRASKRRPNATIAAQARAKRARDHLARKRKQEMNRIERKRSRAATAGSRARTRGRLAPILVFIAFVAGIFLTPKLSRVFLYRTTTLERVAVQGADALEAADIAATLDLNHGRSLDSIEDTEIRQAIKAEPWVESIRSLRLPSGTLVIAVVEREAIARWLAHESDEAEMIDLRGDPFPGRAEPGGPLPLVLGQLDENDRLPASAIQILDELERHPILRQDPNALTLRLPAEPSLPSPFTQPSPASEVEDSAVDAGSGYVLQIGQNGPRAFLGKSSLRQRIARLALLLESEESRLKDARLIDLRYADRAVLRAEPVSG